MVETGGALMCFKKYVIYEAMLWVQTEEELAASVHRAISEIEKVYPDKLCTGTLAGWDKDTKYCYVTARNFTELVEAVNRLKVTYFSCKVEIR